MGDIYKDFLQMCPKPKDAPHDVLFEWEECDSKARAFEAEVLINKSFKSMCCTKHLYDWEMRQARAYAKSIGCKIRIVTKKTNKFGMGGSYSPQANIINIYTHHRSGRISTLYVLYHELRHAQHNVVSGEFTSYYQDTGPVRKFLRGMKGGKSEPLASPYLAYATEMDCDLSAIRWANSRGYKLKESWYHIYPLSGTATMSTFWYVYQNRHKKRIQREWNNIVGTDAWASFIISIKDIVNIYR